MNFYEYYNANDIKQKKTMTFQEKGKLYRENKR